uniref:Prostaglandin-endoperoxide synthase n=1 Tax=Cyclophora tenuis TaxID=216820 RepID=A0A7S1GQD7_CYCTE|mmetsp:Transcript_4508/g.7807  ORF Transcript_4508/g.7807 Transcript_4508/m.7807 type:complete len:585 (+) Transcript_4508:144-1898(+)
MGNAISLGYFVVRSLWHKKFGNKKQVSAMVGLQAVQYNWFGLTPASAVDTICKLVDNPPKYVFQDSVPADDEVAQKRGKLLPYEEYAKTVQYQLLGSNPFEETKLSLSGQWRHIDGGNNNYDKPWMGQGGHGMALRFTQKPNDNLPDAAELIKAFCIRQPDDEAFTPCVNGVNSLVPYFALLVIHDFFRSDTGRSKAGPTDRPWVNLHSSYLDLQTVYGYDKQTAKSVRSQQDGKLKPGAIADHRLDRLAVCHCLILMFAQHHNYICDQLLEKYPDKFKDDDETTFQTARLINTGVYINLIIELYACGLFHVWRDDGELPVDLRGLRYPRDMTGYHLSYEFNTMYRFHAFIPKEWNWLYGLAADAKQMIMAGDFTHSVKSLSDERIKSLLTNAMWNRAGANHIPNNVPRVLEDAEVKGLLDSREIGICCYNDFRESVTGQRYKSFLDLAGGRQDVADKLASFYSTVDDVEFYIGMRVETRDPPRGAGFSDTVGRAILADALSSIRFDRFYIAEYTPAKYTEWGLQHTKDFHMRDMLKLHLDLDFPVGTPLCLSPDSNDMPAKFRAERPIPKEGEKQEQALKKDN